MGTAERGPTMIGALIMFAASAVIYLPGVIRILSRPV
jgi:hypothetical protein